MYWTFPWKCRTRFFSLRKNDALMVQAEAALYMNHMGRWERSRGMRWNRGTKRLPPSFCSQPETLPTAESNRLARFKISANQSVILPPSLLALTPVFCSADVPRGSVAPLVVQRLISYCLFFETAFSCETQWKHANTNWHLIPQAPHRCQLCSHGGGNSRACCVGGPEGQAESFRTGSEVWQREGNSEAPWKQNKNIKLDFKAMSNQMLSLFSRLFMSRG